MPTPRTRIAAGDVIEILDSDSDSEPTAESHQSKRRKVSQEAQSNSMASALSVKNSHLKGRRRFKADLEDLKEACKEGFIVGDLKATKVRSGEEEGSFEVFVTTVNGHNIVSFNVLLSGANVYLTIIVIIIIHNPKDTADYPKDHSCFAHTIEDDWASNIQDVINNISDLPSRSMAETVENTLSNLSKAITTGDATLDLGNEEEEEEDDYEAFMDDDYETSYTSSGNKSRFQLSRMQHDFIDTVASPYRPGLIRFSHDDFCISVSIPVVKLAESIPARALMAWDKRLLSRSQHLVLLISGFRGVYPSPDYTATALQKAQVLAGHTPLTFKVGLSGKYKPGTDHAREFHRSFGLITKDAEDEVREQKQREKEEALAAMYDWDGEGEDPALSIEPLMAEEEEPEVEDEERFDRFSMSSSLESLLDQYFLKLVKIRRRHGVGWAGAELILWEVEKNQLPEEIVMNERYMEIKAVDKEERSFAGIKNLPHDPLAGLDPQDDVNVPLTAFSYLIRRLTLCTRYCIVCHSKLQTNYEALKPYVCDSKLCAYQYYSLNKGPSLEYEIIHNPRSVDLLVSLTYASAAESALDEPFPVGIGLQVPDPDVTRIQDAPPSLHGFAHGPGVFQAHTQPSSQPQALVPTQASIPSSGLRDFDQLNPKQMRASIMELLDSLPSIDDMRKHLRKTGSSKSKPKLVECDPNVLPAAWGLLRWVVGSCTAYLEEITDPSECVQNIDPVWRQYRFSVGAPDAEARFKNEVEKAQAVDPNCIRYPSLFAFHGSPLKNWHSIIRHGLWYKTIAHGRAYGNGVYMAKDAHMSMSGYAHGGRSGGWRKSKLGPSNCVALVEAVNRPDEFVSQQPFFVVQHTHWLMCRYLLVKTSLGDALPAPSASSSSAQGGPTQPSENTQRTPYVPMDPKHKIVLANKPVQVPDPSHKLEVILQARRQEMDQHEDQPDEHDQEVFEYVGGGSEDKGKGTGRLEEVDTDMEMVDDFASNPSAGTAASAHRGSRARTRPADDWIHDAEYVQNAVSHLMPPPTTASPTATMAVQRELKHMLKEQETCSSFKELGWYMPPDLIGDNLFQWIVEMHSFDESLPIAQDLRKEKVNSVIFEIRFPPDFPLSPPFFRIITPRFLPFIQGGGGHVTGGGSICMDLLTSSGWLPSYSIAAILIQIKLAISNPDPRPARLLGGGGWKRPYQVMEALEGYKRAASTHGWQLPPGLDRLVR
ncbi:hypothetical protein PQX77_013106 [Marasmius sp. AFHP31]|nr:hypothetical protein PQX77_013106 [Marasmius sp. AFHP31]